VFFQPKRLKVVEDFNRLGGNERKNATKNNADFAI